MRKRQNSITKRMHKNEQTKVLDYEKNIIGIYRKRVRKGMEIKKEGLDEENEKLFGELENTIGFGKNQEVLRNIIHYHHIMKNGKEKLSANYHIVIRNESNYFLYEELIAGIAKVYAKNGIVKKDKVYYLSEEEFRNQKVTIEELEEEIIVINLMESVRDFPEQRKRIGDWIKQNTNKVFLILEDERIEGQTNAMLSDFVLWSMKIERISQQEKERYVWNFMEAHKLICPQEVTKKLANQSFYILKNELINVFVNCQIKKEKNVANVLGEPVDLEEMAQKGKSGMQELDEMIGLSEVKEQIKKIVNYLKVSKNRKNIPMLHMCFNGNPGTGKTTVARIIGKIFAEEKILSQNPPFIEAQRQDLIGKYVGHTAPMTKEVVSKALGGVLFIDEAYSISSYIQDEAGRDYGAECIATLLKEMEDHRENLCVILAGYTKEMEHMLSVNPGFASRIQFTIDFPDYSAEELVWIFQELCKTEKYALTRGAKTILFEHLEKARKEPNFSNARYVRNLFEKVKIEQASRVLQTNGNENQLQKVDFEKVIRQKKETTLPSKVIGFAC